MSRINTLHITDEYVYHVTLGNVTVINEQMRRSGVNVSSYCQGRCIPMHGHCEIPHDYIRLLRFDNVSIALNMFVFVGRDSRFTYTGSCLGDAAVLDRQVLVGAVTRVDVAGESVVGHEDTLLTDAPSGDCRLHVSAAVGRVETPDRTRRAISATVEGFHDVHPLSRRTGQRYGVVLARHRLLDGGRS